MLETKTCRYCKEEIAKDARICPNCRKKQGKKKWLLITVVVIIIIITAVSVNHRETSGKINSDRESSDSSINAEYTVGDYVEKNNIKVSFVSIKNKSGTRFFKPKAGNTFVYAEFEIENKSDADLVISSVMCFESYFDGYSINTSVAALSADDTVSSIDGTVGPGKKINGVIVSGMKTASQQASDYRTFLQKKPAYNVRRQLYRHIFTLINQTFCFSRFRM